MKTKRVWVHAKRALIKGRNELTRLSKVGQLKMEITRLQRDRDKAFAHLGRKAHALIKEGNFDPGKLDRLIQKVDSIDTAIAARSQRVEDTARRPPPR